MSISFFFFLEGEGDGMKNFSLVMGSFCTDTDPLFTRFCNNGAGFRAGRVFWMCAVCSQVQSFLFNFCLHSVFFNLPYHGSKPQLSEYSLSRHFPQLFIVGNVHPPQGAASGGRAKDNPSPGHGPYCRIRDLQVRKELLVCWGFFPPLTFQDSRCSLHKQQS